MRCWTDGTWLRAAKVRRMSLFASSGSAKKVSIDRLNDGNIDLQKLTSCIASQLTKLSHHACSVGCAGCNVAPQKVLESPSGVSRPPAGVFHPPLKWCLAQPCDFLFAGDKCERSALKPLPQTTLSKPFLLFFNPFIPTTVVCHRFRSTGLCLIREPSSPYSRTSSATDETLATIPFIAKGEDTYCNHSRLRQSPPSEQSMCSHSSRSGLYEKQPEKDRLQRESAHIYSRVQKIFLLAITAGSAFVVARYDYLQRSCVNTLPQDRLTSDAFGINGRAASQLNALLRVSVRDEMAPVIMHLITFELTS